MTIRKNSAIKFSLLLFALILSILLFLQIKSKSPIRINLENIPLKEKEYLSNFFRSTFFFSTFGYTIFGKKPMSIESVDMMGESKDTEEIDYMDIKHIFSRYRMKEGWQAWQKYGHLFPLKGYHLFQYIPTNAPRGYIEIALINDSNFQATVDAYKQDFDEVLGNEFSSQQILDEYLKGKGEVFEKIRYHEGLFGMLLGFGKENAWEYMKRGGGKTLSSFIESDPQDTQHILPPFFAAIPDSQETHDLQQRFEKERIKIDSIYQDKDFLEQVLSRLTGQEMHN